MLSILVSNKSLQSLIKLDIITREEEVFINSSISQSHPKLNSKDESFVNIELIPSSQNLREKKENYIIIHSQIYNSCSIQWNKRMGPIFKANTIQCSVMPQGVDNITEPGK